VLSPGNRAKPCKFRYVKSVRNFMWKLCYRKDDRAMRPIRGCHEIFRDSLTTPTAIIPNFFHGLLFRSTPWMFLQNLKSVYSFSRSWDNRGYPKNGQPLDTPTLAFLQNFYWAFIRIGPVNVLAKFEVRSFTHSRHNRGYPKNLDSPWIPPRSIFSKIFNGLLFGMVM